MSGSLLELIKKKVIILSNLKEKILLTSRFNKQIIAGCSDLICISCATVYAVYISNISISDIGLAQFFELIWLPFFSVLVFSSRGVYKSVLRYINFSAIYNLIEAIFIVLIAVVFIKTSYNFLGTYLYEIRPEETTISFLGWIVGFMSSLILLVSSRLVANLYFSDNRAEKRVIIYGAGSAGIQLAEALRVSSEMQPIAFLDKNEALHNTFLGGLKVLHPKKLERLASLKKVDEVLIAIPSASNASLRALLKEIENYSIKVRILPGLAELAQGKVLVSELKEVDISDLLGRSEVEANQELLNRNIKEKIVLITGAGGSIGSEISRQVSKNNPEKLILLDSNEFALYGIKQELESSFPNVNIISILANVTNKKRMQDVCLSFNVDTIYHAAAYKHVPLVEENPFEAVYNNIIGTKICLEAAIENNVETFVLISTDKAVRPTNIMGATKRFSELILQSFSAARESNFKTNMIMVRFGNVIGSSGSAIPLFQQQIKEGGPITVTHPEVIRYFMSIPEAAELVIQAGAMGIGGDLFVLDMGEPVKITELVKRLINLSGLELKDEKNLEGDIEIIYTGLRPGEKLYEELLIGDKVSKTPHKQILRAEEDFIKKEELEKYIDLLIQAEEENNVYELKEIFKKTIHGYTGYEENVDIISLQDLANQQE